MNKISTKRKQLLREFEKAKAAKVAPQAIEPTYPARNEMPVEQARARVAADFRRWLQAASEWWSGDVDPFESFARAVLQEGEPEPPVNAQKSPTGVGKTKIGAKEIAEDRRARRRAGDNGPMATQPYLYFGPTHRLNDNTANDFRDVDLTARVYRGRFALDPNVEGNKERPEKEQVLMCLAPERVKQAMALYQSISETCCRKRVDGKIQECEYFNACAFQRQLRGEQPDVWLAAHEMLFHDQQALSDVAGIIIDETFYQDGLRGIEEPREVLTLDDIAILGDGVDDSTLALHREKLVEILRKHPLGGLRRDHFIVETEPPPDAPDRIRGIVGQALHPEDCTEAIRKEWAIFGRLVITPGMTEAEIEALKDIIPDCVRARRMVGVWGALREMLEKDIEVSGRLILARKDGKTVLRIRGVRPVLDARMVPTMLLDATLPSELILQKFYPQVDVVSDVQVEMPHVRVRQVLGAPVSQNKLWGTEEDPSKEHHLHAVRRYILQRWLEINGPRLWAEECQRELDPKLRRKPMVVICQKEVRLWLQNAETKHKWYWKVPRPGVVLPEGIALEHFNAIAGLDDHKEVALLMTIGRTLPPPAEVEAIAGALTGKQPTLEAPTGRGYGRVPRAIRMADGIGVRVENCREHVDTTAEAIRFQVDEAELIQAIGRGRGVNRTAETPLLVDIVGDEVLPITEDEVAHWEDPSELVEPRALDGLVPTAQGDMARGWPRVWPNITAAKRTLARASERSQRVISLYRESPNREMDLCACSVPAARRAAEAPRGVLRSELRPPRKACRKARRRVRRPPPPPAQTRDQAAGRRRKGRDCRSLGLDPAQGALHAQRGLAPAQGLCRHGALGALRPIQRPPGYGGIRRIARWHHHPALLERRCDAEAALVNAWGRGDHGSRAGAPDPCRVCKCGGADREVTARCQDGLVRGDWRRGRGSGRARRCARPPVCTRRRMISRNSF
jgi:putative DNA primase/helicase